MEAGLFGAGFLTGLTVWFWVLLLIEAIIAITCVYRGSGAFGIFSLIVSGLVAHYALGIDVTGFVSRNWYWAILWFAPFGVAVSALRWERFAKRHTERYKYMLAQYINSARISIERSEIKNDYVNFATRELEVSDTEKTNTAKELSGDLEQGRIPDKLLGHFKIHADNYSFRSGPKARWQENKDRITSWIAFWPIALVGHILDEWLDQLIEFFGKFYDGLAERHVKGMDPRLLGKSE